MTKEMLEQHVNTQKEITKLQRRIERLRKQSEMVADVVQNGFKGKAVIYGVDVRRKYKIEKYENMLVDFTERLLDGTLEIEEWIEQIPDSKMREIMRCRYLDGLTWAQIQIEAEYEHEDTARNKHDKFLKKFLK